MPVIETRIQHEYIMKFLCRREEERGLGYRETDPNIVSPDLFIPSQLTEFVQTANPIVWRSLMSKYHQDEIALGQALKEEVKARLLEASNAATFLNKNRTITFEGETVPLFYVSGTELGGDADFQKNIFAAVEEMPHNIVSDGITLLRIRPDVSFFVNGIFLGYMELKSNTNGQWAKTNGRGKIITDYLESVKGMADRERINPNEVKSEHKTTLQIFEKSIHLVATDVSETYVLRGIATFFDEARKGFYDRTITITQYRPEIEKNFKIYPLSNPLLAEQERFEEVMTNLYSKKMIEREILYYNFLQYNYKMERGKRVRTSNRGSLISPRPKQKYGCDKVISRIYEMLEKEQDTEFYARRLRKELEALDVSSDMIDEIIRKRDSYYNNKYVYSLLMQYAAGFGKSNIIGWTALQLKDMRFQNTWAFDKILIVVDRLQLRDQLDTMMYNMNIDKSMFVEARDQKTFVEALTDTRRIIVVNIQKFLDLQNAINKSGKKLEKMRVAFLIDEIHRSNTGDNNREMVNIFDQLQETIVSSAEHSGTSKKKNLIIGFTATPSEKILARYGEFKSDRTHIPLWIPFDSYTMKEAIADGYILDPTKHIIPVVTTMHFELPEGIDPNDDDQRIALEKARIYSNPERMEKLAQFIVNRLVSLVYGKIHGTGKAMLAVSSIPNAISYYNIIRRQMERKCRDPKYLRYKDAPVAIVYSDNQEYEASSSMNNNMSEEQVIQSFKQAKNGLIIVVDKLQTGFDEPKLHTLFLDKEIRDINAIQTISRVNRTCKYKEDCHIIDLSWMNVNVENIKEAFKTYCGTTVSGFNPEAEARLVGEQYNDLTSSDPYKRWFEAYKSNFNDVSFMLQMKDGLSQWIRIQFERAAQEEDGNATNEAKRIRRLVGRYASALMMLDEVYEIDDKLREDLFLKFWEVYCYVYRGLMNSGDDSVIRPDIEIGDEVPGITISEGEIENDENDEPDEEQKHNENSSSRNSTSTPEQDILEMIRRWNEREELSAEEVRKWMSEIQKMFESFKADTRFMAVIHDNTFTNELKHEEWRKMLNRYRRNLTQREDIEHVVHFKKMLAENADQLFDMFLEYCNGGQYEDFIEPTLDESEQSELVEETNYIKDDREGMYEELFKNHPKASETKDIDCLELKMRREYAEAILRGTKPLEFREFKDFFIKKLIDMETLSIRQVKKIHFHNYNRSWFLDIECSETDVFSITKDDIEFLQEKYGVHDYDELLEYYEKNHIKQRPRLFYFVVGKVLDTNLKV
jgi:type I restriction enzyme R subunit